MWGMKLSEAAECPSPGAWVSAYQKEQDPLNALQHVKLHNKQIEKAKGVGLYKMLFV